MRPPRRGSRERRADSNSQTRTRIAPSAARSLYTVPSLERHQQLVADGIPGLLSRDGFATAFSQKQQQLVDELNGVTQGTPFEGQDMKSLVIEFARDPMRAYAFNLASMAFNNHFFFRGINTNPDLVSTPPTDLLHQLQRDFASVDTLRETFIATASAMFGPGFVWLVQLKDTTQSGGLRILPTYLAGTPLSGAHYRRQSHDLSTHSAESHTELNNVGAFGSAAKQPNVQPPKKPLGGVDIVPLLCVSTWEHAWLRDYGVNGKDAYLRAWWSKIDWAQARQNGTFADPERTKFQY
ncbi:manganese and iron superoxide dismutase [Didymella exigua CBS 183.55]|uniref:Manganese and iron superoxide dismutase n=1 Tax=Didymella exigua CBS 183.55 TaxID=1150837 RepID=A0A6A5RM92_9PLEO|nr:manganese and iron superoxide dismutase [Didymella exigua CBS 183.55]KAF1929521.1 manganese and iron superoxide dismutase [Didymella exigua CBS 183.55]